MDIATQVSKFRARLSVFIMAICSAYHDYRLIGGDRPGQITQTERGNPFPVPVSGNLNNCGGYRVFLNLTRIFWKIV